jgi:hypothetical protein
MGRVVEVLLTVLAQYVLQGLLAASTANTDPSHGRVRQPRATAPSPAPGRPVRRPRRIPALR